MFQTIFSRSISSGIKFVNVPNILPFTQATLYYPKFKKHQLVGVAGEYLVTNSVFCCNDSLRDMNQVSANYPGVDHECPKCRTGFQVKTSSRPAKIKGPDIFIPMSKTFKYSLSCYPIIRYIHVEYNIQDKSLVNIIISHPLEIYHMHDSRTLRCIKSMCDSLKPLRTDNLNMQ
jgi:hypothetical protein